MKKITFYLLFFIAPFISQSQHFEAGILLGGANYLGDLSENSTRLILKETKLAGGLFVGYQFNEFIGLRMGFNYARLAGSDANAKDELVKKRNLSFFTDIYEFSLRGEWNILGFEPYNFNRSFSPFLFAGLAGFKFDPKTEFLGQKVALQGLGTEGQGMEGRPENYKLLQLSFPFGVGAKYLLTEKLTLGIEFGVRYTLTDYIDDTGGTYANYEDLLAGNGELAAALGNREGEYTGQPPTLVPTGTQRGDNRSHDLYFIAGITIAYNFVESGMMGSRKRIRRKRAGCPTD